MAKLITEFMEDGIMVKIESRRDHYRVIYREYYNATWNYMSEENMTKSELRDNFDLDI
jgi:hypothetical protein